MAEKRKFLDVWIVESNTVYREVPYTVVTDWVQQGRLLEDDRLKPSGSAQWIRLGDTNAFASFLPKVEPFRVEDQAEALEPVQVDFTWKRRRSDEDDDVDMIPLIDISLVLLIFFMMTAAVGGAGTLIATPQAQYKLLSSDPEIIWVGITLDKDKQPEYTMGKGEGGQGESFASRDELIKAMEKMLQEPRQPTKISIRGDHRVPFDVVRDMTVQLGRFQRTAKVTGVFAEVSEKEQP
jgi:biopolymer transport protein ExbD